MVEKVAKKVAKGDAGRRRAPEEERSPRIRGLLGERPHWLVRNGTALLFLLFLLLALGCLFFGEKFVE